LSYQAHWELVIKLVRNIHQEYTVFATA